MKTTPAHPQARSCLKLKAPRKRWTVHLGDAFWPCFTYARLDNDPLRLIGSISRGSQMGALAETSDGHFVQLNGDHVTTLCQSQMRRAVTLARRAPPPPSLWRKARESETAQPVVVIVKRKRTLEQVNSANAELKGQALPHLKPSPKIAQVWIPTGKSTTQKLGLPTKSHHGSKNEQNGTAQQESVQA